MEGLERVVCVWRMELWLRVEVLVLLLPVEVEEDLAEQKGRRTTGPGWVRCLGARGIHEQHGSTSEASRAVHKCIVGVYAMMAMTAPPRARLHRRATAMPCAARCHIVAS